MSKRPQRARLAAGATAPSSAAGLLLLAALAGPAAARPLQDGGSDEEPVPATPSLEDLRALGYASWDEASDERTGVTVFVRERASPGYNLFTNDEDELYLMDLGGDVRHTWRVPEGERCTYFEVLPDGGVAVLSVGHGLLRLDVDSNLLWTVAGNVHHEVEPLPDGGFLTAEWRVHELEGRSVRFDEIVRVSADGEVEDRWSTHDHLDELQRHHPPLALDVARDDGPVGDGRRLRDKQAEGEEVVYDYYHLNSIQSLPASELGERDPRFREGNLLVCMRNASLLLVLDGETREVLWSWGPGELDFPHMPALVDGGSVLLFDNGYHRGWSRVLVVDPVTEDVLWEYRAKPYRRFYSKTRGSAQRLPNGNVLVCESNKGRAFELTPAKRTVWEFWNPELVRGKRKQVYRLLRIGLEEPRWLLDR